MNIVYLLLDPGIPIFGTKGASVHVQEIVRALRADGHRVRIHAVRRGAQIPADLADLDVQEHRLPSGMGPAEREQAITALARTLAEEAVTADDAPDLIYERYSLFSDAGARAVSAARERGLSVPFVLEVNAPLIEEQRQHRHLADEERAIAATVAQLREADVVSCVSEPVARWTIERGAPAERVHVIPNGVNVDRIRPRAPEARVAASTEATRGLRVGFVGTLKAWHGTATLVEAAALARSAPQLEIIGAGPCREDLEQQARDLGIAYRVRFTGAMSPEDVPAALQELDIAAAPYPEGDHYFSPLKVYEYLAAGLPVIASAIGTLPELLEGGRLGVLAAPGSAQALADAIDALSADPSRRVALGEHARRAAVEKHAWTVRCAQLLELAGKSADEPL